MLKNHIFYFLLFSLVLLSCSRKTAPLESRIIEELKSESDILVVKPEETADYFREDFMRYHDYVYKERIKTILFYKEGWELALPLIQLNTDEKLVLTFDDLDADVKNYRITIIHCSAYWKPSDLLPQEYISGFTEEIITDFAFSINTIQKYTHYHQSLHLPL